MWIEAKASAMKKNREAVFLQIPEAASIGLDDLDLGIKPFCRRVRDAVPAVWAKSPGRWRLRVRADSIIGLSLECVAQKYHRSKYLRADPAGHWYNSWGF